jgi:adenylate cyclase
MDALGSLDSFIFEGFRFDLAAGALFRTNGSGVSEPVELGSRALALLALFVERPGHLMSKDDIFAAAWPGTVVGENNLSVQISALRRVLDYAHPGGSCIQTVAGRGYRFVLPVTRLGPEAAPAAEGGTSLVNGAHWPGPEAVKSADSNRPTVPMVRRWDRARVIAASALGLLLIAAIGWHSFLPQRIDATGSAPRLSIVVLPFANLNSNGEQSQFAEAITDDLTTDLSRVQDIVVIPASSSFIYGDRPVNTKRLANEFHARYVLEGSTRRSRDRVRINAQLIDAESGANLWSRRIDRDVDDDLALESEISGHLAGSLNYALVSSEAARPTDRPNAWDYIFRGRTALYNPSSRQNYGRVIQLFGRALELNPRSTEARLYLAIAFTGRVLTEMSDEKQVDLDRAQRLIDQAQLDAPRSPLLHFATAELLRAHGRCGEAMIEYETILASDRNWFSALSGLGRCKIYLGQVDEGIALQQKVVRLSSPDDNIGITYWRLGEAYMRKSSPDAAIPWLEKARVAEPAMGYIHGFLASAYALEQQSEKAAYELAEARRLIPWRYDSTATVNAFGRELGVSRDPALSTTLLDGLRKAGVPD